MQYPVEVPGVSVSNFLRTAATAVKGEAPKLRTWVKDVKTEMAGLEMDSAFAERNVNEGFSGGEKKRHEILQMRLLKPRIAILDETDSGLDVDALRVVSEGVNRSRERQRRRRPADHPLHADPALHQARLRARLRRRPDRRGGRLRARRQARERGLRGLRQGLGGGRDPHDPDRLASRGGAAGPASGRRGDPGGLPDPVPHRAGREAAGLPRLRRHLAEAAPGARRRALVLREHQRRAAPGCPPARRGGDRRLRGGPRHHRRVHRCAGAGDRLHPQQHRGASTWSPTRCPTPRRRRSRSSAGTPSARATRSSSPRWSTTPTCCPGSSCASAPARPCAGSG